MQNAELKVEEKMTELIDAKRIVFPDGKNLEEKIKEIENKLNELLSEE